MEELFEVIIALIVIVGSLIRTASKANKVRQNAPGKAAAPARPAAPVQQAARPAPARPAPAQPSIQPTIHPSQEEAPLPDFWKQMSKHFNEEIASEKKEAGHQAVSGMAEGESRECEHGSVGGSMAYEAHQEGGEMKARPAAAPASAHKPVSAFAPAMNAQEMRRAVVMAEILKRPQERMAEQARRWNVR